MAIRTGEERADNPCDVRVLVVGDIDTKEGYQLNSFSGSIECLNQTELTPITRRMIELVGEFILSEIITGELIECVEWEGRTPAASRLTKKSVDLILDKIITETGV